MLSTAGFKVVAATTPKQEQKLKALPPGKITTVVRNGKTYYVYPDAAHNRIYLGTKTEYQNYQQMVLNNQIAAQNRVDAEMAPVDGADWDVENLGKSSPGLPIKGVSDSDPRLQLKVKHVDKCLVGSGEPSTKSSTVLALVHYRHGHVADTPTARMREKGQSSYPYKMKVPGYDCPLANSNVPACGRKTSTGTRDCFTRKETEITRQTSSRHCSGLARISGYRLETASGGSGHARVW